MSKVPIQGYLAKPVALIGKQILESEVNHGYWYAMPSARNNDTEGCEEELNGGKNKNSWIGSAFFKESGDSVHFEVGLDNMVFLCGRYKILARSCFHFFFICASRCYAAMDCGP